MQYSTYNVCSHLVATFFSTFFLCFVECSPHGKKVARLDSQLEYLTYQNQQLWETTLSRVRRWCAYLDRERVDGNPTTMLDDLSRRQCFFFTWGWAVSANMGLGQECKHGAWPTDGSRWPRARIGGLDGMGMRGSGISSSLRSKENVLCR